jgi:hypothetical protein
VPIQTLERTLDQLDVLKNQYGQSQARTVASLLKRTNRIRITDPQALIRLHEILLFLRAHPHDAAILKAADAQLQGFATRITDLRDHGLDLSELDHPEVSGIAGTEVIDTFGYRIVSWLREHRTSQIDFYWDWFEDENRLADSWPRFMPVLAEDASVEANVPYRSWLRRARGSRSELVWLLDQFSQLQLSEIQKAELYNAQKLYVRWRFAYRDSRTGLRLPIRKPFHHDSPMIQRRDINLEEEVLQPPSQLEKLSVGEGRKAIDMARAASTVRYRELYGFTNGDPQSVYRTALGRGVDLILITLPPEKRLPLRGYHSAMIYRNGVPIGYFEGLSFFDRMESGFNLYYTFRDGETAWLYARTLNVMHHLTGVTAFSLDPYQVGFENEEGIKSGAFWFYRKLGFRSTRQSIERLTEREEAKIRARKNYRTSAATLRRLAEASMIFEIDEMRRGDWDRFQIRHLGFAVQRLLAQKFGGNAKKMRARAVASMADILGLDGKDLNEDFAVTLLLVRDIQKWDDADKGLLLRIIEAKSAGTEATYLRLMQKHKRLRNELIRIGSGSSGNYLYQ